MITHKTGKISDNRLISILQKTFDQSLGVIIHEPAGMDGTIEVGIFWKIQIIKYFPAQMRTHKSAKVRVYQFISVFNPAFNRIFLLWF